MRSNNSGWFRRSVVRRHKSGAATSNSARIRLLERARRLAHERYLLDRMDQLDAEIAAHKRAGTMTPELNNDYAFRLAWLHDDYCIRDYEHRIGGFGGSTAGR